MTPKDFEAMLAADLRGQAVLRERAGERQTFTFYGGALFSDVPPPADAPTVTIDIDSFVPVQGIDEETLRAAQVEPITQIEVDGSIIRGTFTPLGIKEAPEDFAETHTMA